MRFIIRHHETRGNLRFTCYNLARDEEERREKLFTILNSPYTLFRLAVVRPISLPTGAPREMQPAFDTTCLGELYAFDFEAGTISSWREIDLRAQYIELERKAKARAALRPRDST